jgi:acetolactate synthase I/II/III large subunit
MHTTAQAFLDALSEGGVSHLFANLGSDHPAFIETLAEANATGRRVPRLITCPNEMVALSAAHGFAQITGQAQAVLVHVDCGTQSLAGALHNAARGRVPVLIFAGRSPMTEHGELPGSRNEFIHWLQDGFDQHGIVRGYVKYDYEIRTGANVKQIARRALRFAHSDPQGPVYLTAAREVMEQEALEELTPTADYTPLRPSSIPASEIAALIAELSAARRPLIVTSSLGRNREAVGELIRFCRRAAVGVLDSVPSHVNFPAGEPMYQGHQGNEPIQNPALAEADVILLLDTDVPWIPTVNRPSPDARIYQIDVDPLKEQMPLWDVRPARSYRADCAAVLREMNEYLADQPLEGPTIEERRAYYTQRHEALCAELSAREQPDGDTITPEFLTASIRQICNPSRTVFLNEGITNFKIIADHLRADRPATVFTSGASSLGWSGGAAIGMKLARPDKMPVCLTGDGSYLFSQPSTVHWMARRYKTPFLQVIYNNGGWKAPKNSTLSIHPDGYASKAEDIGVSFDPPPDYAAIAAAAGGAFASTVRRPEELAPALDAAYQAVRKEKRCAVLDVWLPHL